MRTASFRSELFRQLLMLAGVFLLGWSALEAAVFVLLESFLFLTLRAAAEITLDPRFGVGASTPARFAREFLKHWLVAAGLLGVLFLALSVAAVLPAFPEAERAEFLAEGIRDPWFLASLAALAGSLARDTSKFARRVGRGRSPQERARDDHGLRAAMATAFFLAVAGVWLGVAARIGVGTRVAAIAIAVVVLYVEAAPHRATRIFQPPAPAP